MKSLDPASEIFFIKYNSLGADMVDLESKHIIWVLVTNVSGHEKSTTQDKGLSSFLSIPRRYGGEMFLLVNWDVKQGADYVHIRLKVAGRANFWNCVIFVFNLFVLTCSVRDMLDAGKVLPCRISSNCWGHSWNWDFKNLKIFYFWNVWNLFIIWIPASGGQYQA